MDTELQRLESSSSMKKSSSNISIGSEHELVKYTSLKDVLSAADYMATGPSIFAHPSFDGVIYSSTLSIRNELLKHAASAYLQSAVILAARDQSWFTRLWRRSQRQWELLGLGWRQYVHSPVGVCFGFVVGSVRAMVTRRRAPRLCP